MQWVNIPLSGFAREHGEGAASTIVSTIISLLDRHIRDAYYALISEEDRERFEREGEVLVIRGGHKGYEPVDGLILDDLPAILDTLMLLEEEANQRQDA
jgi:hypothetical protein